MDEDKRKHNGGKRAGAGRKADKRILEFNELFDKIVPPARMLKMIARLAKAVEKDADVRAFVALTNRRYGMPKIATGEGSREILLHIDF